MAANGTNTALKLLSAAGQKNSGFAFVPKLQLGYEIGKLFTVWGTGGYVSGPTVTNNYAALKPFGMPDTRGFYTSKQMMGASQEEKTNTGSYAALNINLGIGFVIGAKQAKGKGKSHTFAINNQPDNGNTVERKEMGNLSGGVVASQTTGRLMSNNSTNDTDTTNIIPQIEEAAKIKSHSNQANNRTAQTNNSDTSNINPQIVGAAKIKSHSNQANNRTAQTNNTDTTNINPQIVGAAKIKSHSNQANNRSAQNNNGNTSNPGIYLNGHLINSIQSNIAIDGLDVEGITEIRVDKNKNEIELKKSKMVTDKQWRKFKKVVTGDGTERRSISIIFLGKDDVTESTITLKNVSVKNMGSNNSGQATESMVLVYENFDYKK